MARWYDVEFFPPSRPRAARGGIKARSQRGAFAKNWWARRWTAVLEGFQLGARLSRGRSYARRGQVLDIDIEKGRVRSRVQGSRPAPYRVTIEVKVLSPAQWSKVVDALAREARFAANLLAGEMPEDVETAFKGVSVSLFPERRDDLRTECSCPDWSNPCKHIAAVYYILGEEFDRDPFLIFTLRGMPREALIRAVAREGDASPRSRRGRGAAAKTEPSPHSREAPAPEPLRAQPETFWAGAALDEEFFGQVQAPSIAAALAKSLGPLPFWRGTEPFIETLEPIYARAAPQGLAVFLGLERGEDSDHLT